MTHQTSSQHPGARVVVLSGNPRAGSRTTAAAVRIGEETARLLGSEQPVETIELARFAAEILADAHPTADDALRTVAEATVARRRDARLQGVVHRSAEGVPRPVRPRRAERRGRGARRRLGQPRARARRRGAPAAPARRARRRRAHPVADRDRVAAHGPRPGGRAAGANDAVAAVPLAAPPRCRSPDRPRRAAHDRRDLRHTWTHSSRSRTSRSCPPTSTRRSSAGTPPASPSSRSCTTAGPSGSPPRRSSPCPPLPRCSRSRSRRRRRRGRRCPAHARWRSASSPTTRTTCPPGSRRAASTGSPPAAGTASAPGSPSSTGRSPGSAVASLQRTPVGDSYLVSLRARSSTARTDERLPLVYHDRTLPPDRAHTAI